MFILFFLVWVIFNGKITLEITIFGLIISVFIFLFSCKFLEYSLEKELKIWKSIGLILEYIGILIIEIIKANLITMKFILTEREQVDPIIVEFDCDLKTNTARALLADSITLTPGTITVSMEENHYQVHCLDMSLSKDLESCIFVTKLKRLDDLWTKGNSK